MTRFEKLAETLIFGQKWQFFTKIGQTVYIMGKIWNCHFRGIRMRQKSENEFMKELLPNGQMNERQRQNHNHKCTEGDQK